MIPTLEVDPNDDEISSKSARTDYKHFLCYDFSKYAYRGENE